MANRFGPANSTNRTPAETGKNAGFLEYLENFRQFPPLSSGFSAHLLIE